MNIEVHDPKIERLSEEGKTVVFVLVDGEIVGAIALADIIRDESREAVKMLIEMGIRAIMLTGDNRKVAEWVARELGIEEGYSEVLPYEKVEVVRRVWEKGHVVAMVGDGINDAPH